MSFIKYEYSKTNIWRNRCFRRLVCLWLKLINRMKFKYYKNDRIRVKIRVNWYSQFLNNQGNLCKVIPLDFYQFQKRLSRLLWNVIASVMSYWCFKILIKIWIIIISSFIFNHQTQKLQSRSWIIKKFLKKLYYLKIFQLVHSKFSKTDVK